MDMVELLWRYDEAIRFFFDGTCGFYDVELSNRVESLWEVYNHPPFLGMLWGYHGSYNAI